MGEKILTDLDLLYIYKIINIPNNNNDIIDKFAEKRNLNFLL